MSLLDWLAIGAYLVAIVWIGLRFRKAGGHSLESYAVGKRKLSWWVLGISDVAGDAGGDAFWISVIYTACFIGFYRVWWVAAIVALPCGLLWARYWRRLAVFTPTELLEVRYAGRAASWFRGFSAVYGIILGRSIFLAYLLRAFSQIMAPFLGWPPDLVLAVFCGTSVAYTAVSGMLGVAYSDVLQFVLLLAGRCTLAALVLTAMGGLSHILDNVMQLRGPAFLQPYPPSSSSLHGSYSLDTMSLIALGFSGLFGITGSGQDAQRYLAAKNETHAALGHVFNTVLTLVVRMLPILIIGLAAVAMFPEAEDPTQLWGKMVERFSPSGVMGLILAGIIAGYMSSIDTSINAGTSTLLNDFYLRHLRPAASEREQVLCLRATSLLFTLFAYLWARLLMAHIDANWINFVNSIVGLFMLPLALLRWTWWRLNIWGEIAGMVAAFPLAYLVWFPLNLKESPYWMSFAILFGMGWAVILTVTLLTPPEPRQTLLAFFEKTRPPGLWGPIAKEAKASHREEVRRDLQLALLGIVFCASLVVGICAAFALRFYLATACAVTALSTGLLFARCFINAEVLRKHPLKNGAS